MSNSIADVKQIIGEINRIHGEYCFGIFDFAKSQQIS